mmetsp:Transcript_24792/g.49583  ORF Transcript_24792/g.49583 Transcript_24792/m.49583 type:complete len:478 (+) Transcript_24792:140-1573(+)
MGIQDQQLDFEDFSTDTEKLSAILKRTEISSQKHKLSYEYYRARKFLLLLLITLMCATIGIFGFVVTTDAIKRHMKVNNVQLEDVLTLVVGCLGFGVGVLILLMNQWDFGSRESLHLGALVELESLSDRVRFWRMDQKVNGDGENQESESELLGEKFDGSGKGKKRNVERKALGLVEVPNSDKVAMVVGSGKMLKKVEREIRQRAVSAKKAEERRNDVSRFSGFNGAYHQINRSCKSVIPAKLNRPFDLFESRLECMSLGHLGVVWDTRMRRNQIMRLAAVEIYNEISSYWAWPLAIPDIDYVIDRSMRRVARLVSKDYRAPVKVKCCGFTIFRCCCLNKIDAKGNRFNQIVDALEEREASMVQTRAVGDYVETGERRAQPQSQQRRRALENEAYEADKRLGYTEDGRYDDYERNGGYDENSYYDDDYSRGGGGSYYSEDYNRDGESLYTEEENSSYASRGGRGRGGGRGRSRRGGY